VPEGLGTNHQRILRRAIKAARYVFESAPIWRLWERSVTLLTARKEAFVTVEAAQAACWAKRHDPGRHDGFMTIPLGVDQPADPARLAVLLTSFEEYRLARRRLLEVLDLGISNRDPVAEFSEHLVNALLGGKFAASRVQKDYDLITLAGAKVQVRYLANPGAGSSWVNEHHVRSGTGCDRYALVLYESFAVVGVLVFPPTLAAIGAALRKAHPGQDTNLQLTRANFRLIREDVGKFRRLGMQVWLPPFALSLDK